MPKIAYVIFCEHVVEKVAYILLQIILIFTCQFTSKRRLELGLVSILCVHRAVTTICVKFSANDDIFWAFSSIKFDVETNVNIGTQVCLCHESIYSQFEESLQQHEASHFPSSSSSS